MHATRIVTHASLAAVVVFAPFPTAAHAQVEDRPLRQCTLPAPRAPDVTTRGLRQGTLWPDGIIYYRFDSNVTTAEEQVAVDVMADLETICDVDFVERTLSIQVNYLTIRDSDENSADIGLQGGQQFINIFNWNFPAVVAHELMHAMGIRHEQQRADRNTFVNVIEANIEEGKEHNFSIDGTATPIGPYDFDSVMHYGATAFSTNGNPTITIRSPYAGASAPIGQRSHLSDGDRNTLQAMYGNTGPASNDTCLFAQVIAAGASVTGSLIGATTAGTGEASCGLTDGNADVWYRFAAPANGTLLLSTCGTNDTPGYDLGMDTVLNVWSTCLVSFATELACNDDDTGALCGPQTGADLDSGLSLNMLQGEQVQIRVSHHVFSAADNAFVLNADFRMLNDTCLLADEVFPGESLTGTLSGATNDGTASCGFTETEADVWYRFIAPGNGTLLVNTCGTHDSPDVDEGMYAELSLHTACPGSPGSFELDCNYFEHPQEQCVGIDNGFRKFDSALEHNMTTGESVLVRVSHTRGFMRDAEFNLNVNFEASTCPCETDGVFAQVDVFDLLTYLNLWFALDPAANFDANPTVDVFDLLAFLDCWFPASEGNPC